MMSCHRPCQYIDTSKSSPRAFEVHRVKPYLVVLHVQCAKSSVCVSVDGFARGAHRRSQVWGVLKRYLGLCREI